MIPRLFILVCLFIATNVYSQNSDTTTCDRQNSKFDSTITAFIKGKKGKEDIIWRFFYKKFELKLSDPSYKIQSFHIVFSVKRKNYFSERLIYGSIVTPDFEGSNISDAEKLSLKNIGPGDMITFDLIFVKKDGRCYSVKPFIVFAVLNE